MTPSWWVLTNTVWRRWAAQQAGRLLAPVACNLFYIPAIRTGRPPLQGNAATQQRIGCKVGHYAHH